MAHDLTPWKEAQVWERNWWMSNTDQHEVEQLKNGIIAGVLGIRNVQDLTVLDIGCGPFSLLQRFPAKRAVAVDPLNFGMLDSRYTTLNIERVYACGEDIDEEKLGLEGGELFDEVWMYNVLQHVKDPVQILNNAARFGKIVRLFEWTFIQPCVGHLHLLTPYMLKAPFAKWNVLHQATGNFNHSGLEGNYFTGIFERPEKQKIE